MLRNVTAGRGPEPLSACKGGEGDSSFGASPGIPQALRVTSGLELVPVWGCLQPQVKSVLVQAWSERSISSVHGNGDSLICLP